MKPKWRVLVSAPYAMPALDWYRGRLAEAGCEMIVAPVQERLEEEQLLALLVDMDGLICGDDRITDRVLAAFPRLRVISKWGTGIDSIDQEACRRRGVTLCNTPNAFSEPVADTVLAYMLLTARQPDRLDAGVRSGAWPKTQLTTLGESTLGVIGVGNCGRAVIRRARAFGMTVLGFDSYPVPPDFLRDTATRMVGLEELLRSSDYISLHLTLSSETHQLINAERLALLRPTAYLINTARGPLVEEAALAAALAAGRLAGAALDVFEVEPLPASSPLRRLANCRLGAHHANSSPAAAWKVHENTVANLVRVLNQKLPPA